MTTLTDNSTKSTAALLKEARAVKRTAKAYEGLNRGTTPASSGNTRDISRDIVIAFLGGGKV